MVIRTNKAVLLKQSQVVGRVSISVLIVSVVWGKRLSAIRECTRAMPGCKHYRILRLAVVGSASVRGSCCAIEARCVSILFAASAVGRANGSRLMNRAA